MALLDQVVVDMQAAGRPALPPGHPICDGKERRYGPKKKAWYKLTSIDRDGKQVVYGSFGFWQGDYNGAVGVSIQDGEVSKEELAAARQRAEEAAKREEEKRAMLAHQAANRARSQWNAGADAVPGVTPKVSSPYLARKKVIQEVARTAADGTLLVPMRRYSLEHGVQLMGLQKIRPDGSKAFNKGMDKVGTACLLGKMRDDTPVVLFGEGYATMATGRMAVEFKYPAVVGFDAGNLMAVAKGWRRDFPKAHFLFLADDDWQLKKRLAKRLVKDFCITATLEIDGERQQLAEADFVDDKELDAQLKRRLDAAVGAMVPLRIDGQEQQLLAEDNTQVMVTPSWRIDGNGIQYLEADVRAGRVVRTLKIENAGIARATAAAKEVGNASVVWPTFANRGQRKWTDFNDLHVEESLDAVASQIKAAIDVATRVPAAALPPALSLVKNSPPPSVDAVPAGMEEGPSAPVKGEGDKPLKKPKKIYPQSHWDTVNFLLDHFVLIYGDDTAWDAQNRIIIKIAHMRLAYTSDAVKFWLNNPDRKMVNKDCVVFDPTETADPETHVNLYHGFVMQPKPGKCEKIIELLQHLCNNDAEVMAWVLRWIAYPLQHKGAKMRTSIIIHGDEGSGKNLFWENVVRRIYGEYGGVIGNAQIEAQFNEWASRKLFFVADEVVTRTELRQLKGKLKHMVTGETIMINPKGMTERAEANHMNFVFLSNELQPLALDKTDRRYLVLWTPPNKSPEFYKAVAEEINNGGVEAFYDYLMKVPLADFNEHTKPMVTEAKVKLIGLGLSPPEKFYREWSGGFLPLPYVCCSAMQLYKAFTRWCNLNGERFPVTQTYFGRAIDRIGVGEVRRGVIKYDLESEVKQRTVYLVGKQPDEKTRSQWVEDASALFETYLKKYRHVYDQGDVDS